MNRVRFIIVKGYLQHNVVLSLLVQLQNREDSVISLLNLFSGLGTSENDFTADEDQDDYFRIVNSVDETREYFRLVLTEIDMLMTQTL